MLPGLIYNMTLEEQIGQLFMVGFWGTTPSPEVLDMISRYYVGGVILFSRNVQDTQQVLELTSSLQEAAGAAGQRYPLLIAIDQENGVVQRLGRSATQFPGNMALGAIGSEQMVHDIAYATGRALRTLGINMNLAPVVDVNNNPANPVIGVRSFGEDPQQVARLGAAAVRGYQDAGIISTLKHFPGHGDTAVDSHLSLPMLPCTLERLEQVELVPFREGIEAGADCVMSAHIAFPAITRRADIPATLSPAIIQGLLREKLGFHGVVISDCLEMQAVADTVGIAQGSVLALQAGIDLVLVSHLYPRQQSALEAALQAVQSGGLPYAAVRQAVERVLQLKSQRLSWENLPSGTVPSWVGGAEHQQLSERAYALSTTLVRNEDGLVPLRLRPHERILVLATSKDMRSQAEDRQHSSAALVESMRRYHDNVESLTLPADFKEEDVAPLLATTGQYDLVIMVTVGANRDPQQGALMRALLQSGLRVIGLAVGTPYDLLAFPRLRTYLVTYEPTDMAQVAVAKVLFGQVQPRGHLPVSLPVANHEKLAE
ncbi:MAG TPA: beta-N-acetylhexosaminidase [Ktedonobacteraceae bacterium]|nr:beta-N-acetylhexosaminidase [Ktedonobacteraceae bacterium]